MKNRTYIALVTIIAFILWACSPHTTQTSMQPDQFFDGPALAMAKAIQDDNINQIKALKASVELNSFYKENMTFLIWAMLQNKEKAFKELLQLGADPNLKDVDNVQIVALAAGASDDNKYLRLLLQQGGNPDSWQEDEPAVHKAFIREYFKNVNLLLDAGGNINIKNEEGSTLLNTAGYLRWFDKAIELINRGADATIPTENGGSIALQVQENKTAIGSEAYQNQGRLKKILQDKGVKFPVLHPSRKRYVSLLAQWHATPEGKQWQERLQVIADDPMGFGQRWVDADDAAFAAFKAWMKANAIPEPTRPE